MFVSLLALALQAQSVTVAPAAATSQITITGTRLKDYAAALDACVTARCPPRQDMVASIRYAEALFRRGDYLTAREVLAKSVGRNAGAGAAEPVVLSQLYLAQANVAAHYGEQRDVERATYASARVAHKYLDAGSPDVLWADLRVADYRLQQDRRDGDAAYRRVAADARAAGHPDIAASADIHRAWSIRRSDPATAFALLAALGSAPGEAARPYRLAARVLTARIARERGDAHATDAVLAAMRADPDPGAPMLVYSPPVPQPADPVIRDPIDVPIDNTTRSSDYRGLQWVDIGFAIRADGSVDTPEVLRSSRSSDWAAPLLHMIAGRRYSPTAGNDDAPGHYRVERFTYTADFTTPTGSLIRRRAGTPRFESIDLTDPAEARGGASG